MAVKRQTQVNSQEELLDSDFPTDTPPQRAVQSLYVEPKHTKFEHSPKMFL